MPIAVAVAPEVEGENPKSLRQRLRDSGPFLGVAGEPVEEQDRVSRSSELSHGQGHVAVGYVNPTRGVTHGTKANQTGLRRRPQPAPGRVLNLRLAPVSG